MAINKETHLSNLLGSLNKFFINAKTKGIVRNKELYLLNLINTLITSCDVLSDKEIKELTNIYFNLLNRCSFLCKSDIKLKHYIHENKKINPTNGQQMDSDEIRIFADQFNDIFS